MKKTIAIRDTTTHRYSDKTICVIGAVHATECIIGSYLETRWEEDEFARPPVTVGPETSNFEYPLLETGGDAFASIGDFDPDAIRRAGLKVGYPFGAKYIYGRLNLPQHELLSALISALERVQGGLVTPAGVAASHLAMLFNLSKGATVLRSAPIYDCTRGAFDDIYPNLGINILAVDFTDLEVLEAAIKEHKPEKLYLETPANPTMAMIDLAEVYKLAIKYGIREIIVDNTFASPLIQKPIDIVGGDPHRKIRIVHSGTKHFTGGLDGSVWGYVSLIDWHEFTAIDVFQKNMGWNMSGADANYALQHGLPTLYLRVKDQSANALKVAKFLEGHPLVKKVNYPGLEPFKEMADRMFTGLGYGSLLYFELDDQQLSLADSEAFGDIIGLQSFIKLAVSLGRMNTLIENSWFMVHRYMEEEEKRRNGISPFGWRIAVGSEDVNDIIYDLRKVLSLIKDPEFRRRLPELRARIGRPPF